MTPELAPRYSTALHLIGLSFLSLKHTKTHLRELASSTHCEILFFFFFTPITSKLALNEEGAYSH